MTVPVPIEPPPDSYTCFRCGNQGHWIKNCPTKNGVKRSTGIPRSFMVRVDGLEHKGALLTSSGDYAVPLVAHQAYEEVKEKPTFVPQDEPESRGISIETITNMRSQQFMQPEPMQSQFSNQHSYSDDLADYENDDYHERYDKGSSCRPHYDISGQESRYASSFHDYGLFEHEYSNSHYDIQEGSSWHDDRYDSTFCPLTDQQPVPNGIYAYPFGAVSQPPSGASHIENSQLAQPPPPGIGSPILPNEAAPSFASQPFKKDPLKDTKKVGRRIEDRMEEFQYKLEKRDRDSRDHSHSRSSGRYRSRSFSRSSNSWSQSSRSSRSRTPFSSRSRSFSPSPSRSWSKKRTYSRSRSRTESRSRSRSRLRIESRSRSRSRSHIESRSRSRSRVRMSYSSNSWSQSSHSSVVHSRLMDPYPPVDRSIKYSPSYRDDSFPPAYDTYGQKYQELKYDRKHSGSRYERRSEYSRNGEVHHSFPGWNGDHSRDYKPRYRHDRNVQRKEIRELPYIPEDMNSLHAKEVEEASSKKKEEKVSTKHKKHCHHHKLKKGKKQEGMYSRVSAEKQSYSS